jgi:hypothetical protein
MLVADDGFNLSQTNHKFYYSLTPHLCIVPSSGNFKHSVWYQLTAAVYKDENKFVIPLWENIGYWLQFTTGLQLVCCSKCYMIFIVLVTIKTQWLFIV